MRSSGPLGHNVEYVLRLAEWLHKAVPDVRPAQLFLVLIPAIPQVHDEHLYSIEWEVRLLVSSRKLCLATLMGEKVRPEDPEGGQLEGREQHQGSPDTVRRGTFQHTCENKCLKCVKL